MRRDLRWPLRCTLSGCTDPGRRPHHHHMAMGHLVTAACSCPQLDQPGARPRVDEDGNPKT